MQNPNKPVQDEPEEALVEWLLTIWKKIEDNYATILAGIGGIAVAVLIFVFINNQQAQEAQEAREALGQVYIDLFEGRVDEAINKSQELASQYSGEPVGKEALIASANLQFEQKRISEARASFQSFLDQYSSDGVLVYGAWSGLAACHEAEGNFMQAAEQFKSYADKHPDTPFAPVALKEAGRCYQLANQSQQAQSVYQVVVDKYHDSSISRIVTNELKMMGVDVEG
jgi:outer membrane protein assembly factor BamD (BamD/ComL family)